ncbi:hypothetical protein INF37_11645 [Pseudoflavonifractor sp. DSM 107456]|uniref:Uncharacterized protein n=1 Tax=Pseudoflavonifractor gallinarum TaxID=2779352 RepID=A0ABR9RD51_9FIRM|nr:MULTISPECIES: hypothetical protein [Eubacteriales]MBE5056641.1 hypothetical protein [Pseudoflavonifractor gallinarum]MBS5135202.1 hypothetical protein [Oscillospiraceae bacterium]
MMETCCVNYRVVADQSRIPAMYGIEGEGVPVIQWLSTECQAVEHLVRVCNRLGLSYLHMGDVAEDFRNGGLIEG